MTIRMGFFATRLSDALTEDVLFARNSVETIKNANVIEASHATIAAIGIFAPSP